MKLNYLIIISLLISGCTQEKSYQIAADSIPSNEKHIILMHPTVNNVRTFEYLVSNNIFPLPAEYKAIGVYHAQEKFDYSKTEEYLRKNGITNISLVRITSDLSPDNIYKNNSCSDTFSKLFEGSNGAIFFGGPDIPPACYGEQTNLLTIITDPYRHYMELSFLFHMLGGNQDSTYSPFLTKKPDYAILGICLGMQSINVATGGTMYQDIPTELYSLTTLEEILNTNQNQQHRNYQTNYGTDDEVTPDSYHQIVFEKGSPLFSHVSNDTIHPYVLSSHHQCIEKLGRCIQVAAWSMDGKIVESITHKSFPNLLGVQFHPEVNDLYKPEEKIKAIPLQPAEKSFIDLYSGDKGENFQRAIWREFAGKFK
ncbi:MAG: gamma-glutamyl-gamma-aminobutyrate hydrolase family protein [Tenuifilaceae bacterium]